MKHAPAVACWLTVSIPVLAALAGCDGPAGKVRSRFGSDALAIIAGATQAEAYRIERDLSQGAGRPADPSGPADDRSLGGYKILSGPVLLEETRRRRLERILFSAGSYEWNRPKGCLPTPGVGIRYRQGDQEAHVHLCFECRMLSIGLPGAGQWQDFDPVNAPLVRLVQETFPRDPVIQGLKE